MHILILGGGVFLGAATLTAALARGHRVTVFNRGRERSHWPDGVEAITGDRSSALAQLEARHWDAVIDTCGYTPADLRLNCYTLRGCGRYLFVSSISAYATTHQVPVRETDPLASFDAIAPDDRDLLHYGPQKAACEAEVRRVFGERALLVRPGLIVGPGDRSGRFSYWPWRVIGDGEMTGGEMLVPDVPAGEPLQFIDVRDLAAWMVVGARQLSWPAAKMIGAPQPTRPKADCSLRPWQPIRERASSGAVGTSRPGRQHEPQGQLLG